MKADHLIMMAAAALCAVSLSAKSLVACTGITPTAQDGSVIQARTREWGAFDLRPQLVVIPRGVKLAGATPDGLPRRPGQCEHRRSS